MFNFNSLMRPVMQATGGGGGDDFTSMAQGFNRMTGQQPEGGAIEERAPVYYVDAGKIVKKRNFFDATSGTEFPIFEDYRDLPPGVNLPNGTVVDPSNVGAAIPSQGPPTQAPPAQYAPQAPAQGPFGTPQGSGNMQGSPDFDVNAVRRQAQAAPMGQAAAPTGPAAADNSNILGNMLLYDPENARMAIQQVMRAMGRNPNNGADLFGQMLQRAAPGLAMSFELQNALGGGTGQAGMSQDVGGMFKNFLMSVLPHAGTGPSGSVFNTLSQGAKQLTSPGLIGALRNYGNNSGDVNQQNPFLDMLNSTLTSNSGQGMIAALAALNGPGMGQGMLRGYQSGLNASLGGAMNQYVQGQQEGGQGGDLWKYLLGV